LIQAVNASNVGVTAALNTAGKLQFTTNQAGSDQSVTLTQVAGSAFATTLGLANGTSTGTDATATVNGVTYNGQGNSFTIIGAGAGSLIGLQFTAAQVGTTQLSVSATSTVVAPTSVATGNTQGTSQPLFSAFSIAAASRQLVNALVADQFSLFNPQQSLFSWLQGGNLLGAASLFG
jgi:flagellin